MSFETDIARIEEIAQKLNAPDTPLEQSIKLFEEGMRLAKALEKSLAEAKRSVEVVLGESAEEAEITTLQ